MINKPVFCISFLFITCFWSGMVMAQKPELLIKPPVYADAWDDSHYGRMIAPFYQATIDRSGVAPFSGPCDNPITVAAEVPIIDGLKQFHPATTVKLSRPLTPGKRYYVDFDASVLSTPYEAHPTTYYNYWPQIFPTNKQAPTNIYGNWRYMVTQTHWRTEYGQFLSRKIRAGEPLDFSEPEPLQMAIWPLEEINYLTFVFTSLGQNAFLHVPVDDSVTVSNIRICPCEEGPVLAYNLAIPKTPHNIEELKLVGLTLNKEEVDSTKWCGISFEEDPLPYVSSIVPNAKDPAVRTDQKTAVKKKKPVKKRPAKLPKKQSDEKATLAKLPEATPAQLDRVSKKSGPLVKVTKGTFRIGLRDHQLIDGDIVTILVNGHILVEGYELKKRITWFDAPLIEGDNQITLFAENLGSQAPNTASITLQADKYKKEVILSSDMEESAFFIIRVE